MSFGEKLVFFEFGVMVPFLLVGAVLLCADDEDDDPTVPEGGGFFAFLVNGFDHPEGGAADPTGLATLVARLVVGLFFFFGLGLLRFSASVFLVPKALRIAFIS